MADEFGEMVRDHFDSGRFFAELSHKIAVPTEVSHLGINLALTAYLERVLAPELGELGFVHEVHPDWRGSGNSFLIARRMEDPAAPTVLCYGHGDVVNGMAGQWENGRDPWRLSDEDGRWYGRGSADNKGQHQVNLSAVRLLLERRGSLGFNLIFLFEGGEEIGSPALDEFVREHREELRADVMIGSDGPRVDARTPTLFLGNRGAYTFRLTADLRADALHSGNWGGVLRNAATTVTGAVESIVDGQGRLLVPGLQTPQQSPETMLALSSLRFTPDPEDPEPDLAWFDPRLDLAERVWGSNVLEVLALQAGDADDPVNAIPGQATAVLQLRYLAGSARAEFPAILRQWLDDHGYGMVEVSEINDFPASRTEVSDPWVGWAVQVMREAIGKDIAVLPNIGGSLPNKVFAETLGLPTLWVPHSYPGCRQHAPDEHFLESIGREGLLLMCALFDGLGHSGRHPAPISLASSVRTSSRSHQA
ncbi:M20/M25/M40 family metallo-hydrolase [Arthrobacter sp. NPDC090010]|uniref:M20/M25/M40 family metallo-hydrolase n=1 Tax=Arthrobacter sp. NPDC090010 TaxID=3363942 RepID=UPI00381D858C